MLDENQQMLADFASEHVIDLNERIPEKRKLKQVLASTDCKDCNVNEKFISCRTIGDASKGKCKHHQKVDEMFDYYMVKHLDPTDNAIIDEIWESTSIPNTVRIGFEQTDN